MTNELSTIKSFSPVGNNYSWAYSAPLLSAEQEHLLLKESKNNDKEAIMTLVHCNVRNVLNIVNKYDNYGFQKNDLIQEGIIGLMKAIKNFDINKEVRLISFAAHWIKSEILTFIVNNWHLVKTITNKSKKKAFFKLNQVKAELFKLEQSESEQNIGKLLDVDPIEVATVDTFKNTPALSLDAPTQTDSQLSGHEIITYEKQDRNFEINTIEKIKEILNTLDEKSQIIINNRYFSENKMTFKELANRLNISAEAVRKRESKIIQTLKRELMI